MEKPVNINANFISILREIMKQDWIQGNRATYSDGVKSKTKRIFSVSSKYDLQKEFPLGSVRPVPFLKCVNEILWIYQKQSVDTKDLNSNIWDQWTDENGLLHNCYGAQIAKPSFGSESQMHYVLNEIKNNPSSRRIMTCMWDTENNDRKSLMECAFMTQWNVRGEYLDMIMYQRSQDFMVAFLWNVCQYAALLSMVAHSTGLKPGVFTHVIGDCHLYDRHEQQAMEMLDRVKSYSIPQVHINSEDRDFWKLTENDFDIWNYEPDKQLKMEVAI